MAEKLGRLDKTALLVMGTDVELKESLPRQGLSAIVSENPLGIHHVSIKNKKEKRIILINIAPLSQYWGVEASFPGRITVIKNPNVYEAGRDYRWHTLTPHTIKSTDPTKPSGITSNGLPTRSSTKPMTLSHGTKPLTKRSKYDG
jgi:hypothetical protein